MPGGILRTKGCAICNQREGSMYRFFAEEGAIRMEEKRIRITGSDVNHMKNVLRMKQGEQVTISDRKDNDYICQILSLSDDCVELEILFREEQGRELPARIYLFQGLPKSDKMELIIQKAVELGAAGIIPVEMKRCVMKVDAKKARTKLERWNAIACAAAKQSKRGIIPEVHEILTMKEALHFAKAELHTDLILLPYELAEGMEATKRMLERLHSGMNIAVFIGPEGGFSPEEVVLAKENGAEIISLGRRILRTETAGMALLSAMMLRLEG